MDRHTSTYQILTPETCHVLRLGKYQVRPSYTAASSIKKRQTTELSLSACKPPALYALEKAQKDFVLSLLSPPLYTPLEA